MISKSQRLLPWANHLISLNRFSHWWDGDDNIIMTLCALTKIHMGTPIQMQSSINSTFGELILEASSNLIWNKNGMAGVGWKRCWGNCPTLEVGSFSAGSLACQGLCTCSSFWMESFSLVLLRSTTGPHIMPFHLVAFHYNVDATGT